MTPAAALTPYAHAANEGAGGRGEHGRAPHRQGAITGAAGGIGRATAERFASEGASVVLVDLPDTALEESVAAVGRAGGEALAVTADVTRAADHERYMAEATARFGGVDCFFNSAGIEGFVGPMLDYPEEMFDRVIAINLKGVFIGVRPAAARSSTSRRWLASAGRPR